MTTVDELKEYYANRLIMQYRGKERATGTVEALVQESWLDGVIQEEAVCFDLDTAIGEQLNVLGRIVGVPREIYGLDLTHTFLELTDYAESVTGVDLQVYTDTEDGPEIMLRYRSDAIYTLTEFEMRTLIKLKIIGNTTLRSMKNLMDAFYDLFGDAVELIDNLDMTITINVEDPYQNIFAVAEYIDIVPKPMGVGVTINNV